MKEANGSPNLPTDPLIVATEAFVRNTLSGAESGHDWWHIYRVRNNARQILKSEDADPLIVELAVLLHDISDSKFNGGDEEAGPKLAADYLRSIGAENSTIIHVEQIIRHMSYRSSLNGDTFNSPELNVVRDADRLDAIGAMGIARAFTYGGFKNRELYNPDIPSNPDMSKEEYKSASSPTINHFYEKLLLLKDKMHTAAGRKLAYRRHEVMLNYLDQFYDEWEGRA